jgi:nitroimidazol reductase NimA-like FMN-containing flavoprotein (pyridoxamine 5'-phosphate oxidase superfamily)
MQELKKEEMVDLLLKVRDGVLALSDGKLPYCIPFGFVYVKDSLHLSMFPTGRKWKYYQQNPMVCFNTFRWNDDYTEWSSVVIDGKMEEVRDLETIELVVKANIEKLGLDPNRYLEKRMPFYRKNLHNPRGLKIFRINAQKMRGRKMAFQIRD